jgi:hypothetical protein
VKTGDGAGLAGPPKSLRYGVFLTVSIVEPFSDVKKNPWRQRGPSKELEFENRPH